MERFEPVVVLDYDPDSEARRRRRRSIARLTLVAVIVAIQTVSAAATIRGITSCYSERLIFPAVALARGGLGVYVVVTLSSMIAFGLSVVMFERALAERERSNPSPTRADDRGVSPRNAHRQNNGGRSYLRLVLWAWLIAGALAAGWLAWQNLHLIAAGCAR